MPHQSFVTFFPRVKSRQTQVNMRSLIPVKTGGLVKVINADQITQVVHAIDPHTIDLHKSSINIGISNHTQINRPLL